MHGTVQLQGESCRSLRRSSSQHMRSALSLATNKTTEAAKDHHHSSFVSPITTTTTNSFLKDGREINVGDCALFKPPQDSPPFIGLIRLLAEGENNNLQLGVHWLYRPGEIELVKDTAVEGAPNEIFYSFHEDKTPAASLLHPCKVAFLPRGVELPAGTSSFVCRRVYDITNKCLWWLTDQDYINERQEEVDQLLYRTRLEMHTTMPPGGRSPKQTNGPTSNSQLKNGLDNVQNSGTPAHSQVKVKKRERGDHSTDPVKREHGLRSDDGDSFQCKSDNILKSEIAQITEKGGLVDLEGVEKLVQLMHPEKTEKKLDLVSRTMLVGVIAATDSVDCLNRFVRLRGLPVLDEWLQDIHKGKIGDGNGLKEYDKSIEDFLLVLLRGLDKLPINLQALQMCNIGRSVNHLRSSKNLEIQRKARSLVDTWKKGVEAEMISIDAKTASTQGVSGWPSKSRQPDSSHGGNRTLIGSDAVMKSSVTLNSASKTTSARSSHSESSMKPATTSPGQVKSSSSPSSCKENLPRVSVGGAPEAPLIREDRSSSSNNQSHNYTQSITGKEDGKSGVAAPATVNKVSGVSTRSRKISVLSGASVIGNQKEISSSRISSAHKSTASEKLSQSLSSEKVLEGLATEGSSHKLIVKIPNRVRSPAQAVVGGPSDDSTNMNSRVSSPVLSDKQEQFDGNTVDKSGTHHQPNAGLDTNMGARENGNSAKDALTGSTEVATSPAAYPDKEHSMTTKDCRGLIEGSIPNQLKSGKLHASSFSPMNALIESCAKYSEANTSLSIDDDVGMKLLASVATEEMSRSDFVSPADSTGQSTAAVQEVYSSNDAKSKSVPENNITAGQIQTGNEAEDGNSKQALLAGGSMSPKHASDVLPGDSYQAPSHISEEVHIGESKKHFDPSSVDMGVKTDKKREKLEKSNEKKGATSLMLQVPADNVRDSMSNGGIQEEKGVSKYVGADGVNLKCGGIDVSVKAENASADCVHVDEDKHMVDALSQHEHRNDTIEELDMGTAQHNLTNAIVKSEIAERSNTEEKPQSACGQKPESDATNQDKVLEINEKDSKSCTEKSDTSNSDMEMDGQAAGEGCNIEGLHSASNEVKNNHKEVKAEKGEILEPISVPDGLSVEHEELQKGELKGSISSNNQKDEADEHASTCVGVSSTGAGGGNADTKMTFDLNEGASGDEGKYGDPTYLAASGATTVHPLNTLAFSASSIPSSQATSVTVAAAAKGPFVPPEDLLRSKGEIGWKGSAATSAFRPAEPRKALEMSLGSSNMSCLDGSPIKQCRTPLDIDLNVPDERVLEEIAYRDSALAVDSTTDFASGRTMLPNEAPGYVPLRGSVGLDLDLNRVDETSDIANCSTSIRHKAEGSFVHVKSLGGLPAGDVQRDFDLNDGPGVDDAQTEPFSINYQARGVMPPHLSYVGPRGSSPVRGSFSSWFPPGNAYSTLAIPSVFPDRGEHPIPVFPPSAPQRSFTPSGVATFTPDVYRSSVLSSSPAVPFPAGPFQFPLFPFGTTFPLPSATFSVGPTSYVDSPSGPRLFAPPMHSQFLGPVGSVASQFQRPYMVSIPDSTNHGLENNRWGRAGLDLNAGPGTVESGAREEKFPPSSGQPSVASSQTLAEDYARMYSANSGILKRKEPEGGWDNERFRFKQSS